MANLIPISTVVVGSGGASAIEFNGIPQSYTDLYIVLSTRTNRSNEVDAVSMIVNGDTIAANYAFRFLYAIGTGTVGSLAYTTYNDELAYTSGNTATSSAFGSTSFYIPSYTVSQHKSVSIDSVGETNGTNARMNFSAYIWKSNNPINSLKFIPITGNTLQQYSTATLYGIRKY